MHLVPDERSHLPSIDGHRVCDAIEAMGEPGHLAAWAARYSLLSDPHRLGLLLAIRGAGPISVTDLALATGMNATTVSQALRLLKAADVVAGTRDGKVIRYRLSDPALDPLLAMSAPPNAHAHAHAGTDADAR